jgi:hypothetical protein
MSANSVTERIKKLLRLAADKRGNPHEAERALALAFELGEKHRVDIKGLDLDEKSAELLHEYFAVGYRFDRMKRGIFGLLQNYFHVTLCLCGPRMLVVGRREDVMIAQYVYDFLRRAGSDCLAAYKRSEKSARRRMTANKRASFTTGFIYGIGAMLRKAKASVAISDSTTALIVAEEAARDAYVAKQVGQTEKLKALPQRKNEGALMSGFTKGTATKINQPLTTSGGPQLQLL